MNKKPIVEIWLPKKLDFNTETKILGLYAKATEKASQIINNTG